MYEKRTFPDFWDKIDETKQLEYVKYLFEHYKDYEIRLETNGILYIDNVFICPSGATGINSTPTVYFVNCAIIPGSSKVGVLLKQLSDICIDEFVARQQQAKIEAEAEAKRKKEQRKSNIKIALYIGLMVVWVALVAGLTANDRKKSKREAEIDKQVKKYEQTLPGYVEQQKLVDQYRDSLRNVKTK